MTRRILFLSTLLIVLSSLTTACAAALASTSKPTVVITSPASNSQFRAGEQVTVQSTSTDSEGIGRVDLLVDGNVVRTDPSPMPQNSFTVNQSWEATPGAHLITVRAFNAANVASEPAAVNVTVLPATETPTPTPTGTPSARACTNSATFVADVTVPDGTALAPGQPFDKIWRVRNTGTCTWGTGNAFVFTGGEAMTTTPAIVVPNTAPGSTADLLIPMAAPTTPGTYTGTWRLKSPSGAFFGATLNATINVVSPVANCPSTPVIGSFTASPSTITAGQSAALNWGSVTGAEQAEIDNGIGGVATPGSTTVSPASTTTYTLTATCGSKVSVAQVTVTVVKPGPPPTSAPPDTPTPGPTDTPIPAPTETPTP